MSNYQLIKEFQTFQTLTFIFTNYNYVIYYNIYYNNYVILLIYTTIILSTYYIETIYKNILLNYNSIRIS